MEKSIFDGRDIALIGNAESLLSKRYGTMIDSHDMVVRMNRVPQHEQRASLGWRTDLFVYASPTFKNVRKNGVSVHEFDVSGYHHTDRPSSGMRIIYHIVKFTNYKSLTLYGFDFMDSASLTTPTRLRTDNPHDFTVEEALIQSYETYGVLSICR